MTSPVDQAGIAIIPGSLWGGLGMKKRLIASIMAAMFAVASVPGQTISALAEEQASVEETYAAGSEGGQADQTQAVAAETSSPDNTSEASAAGVAPQVAGDDVSDTMAPELITSDTGAEASLIEDQDSQPSEVVPDDVLSADQSLEGEMPEDGIIEEGSDSAAGDSGLISEDGQEAVSGNMVEERASEAETKLGEDEPVNLELGKSVETTFESIGTRVFTFTPSETGAYRFYSVGDTKDSGIDVSISTDLSGYDSIGYGESQAEGVLEAGTKYYLLADYYKDNGVSLKVDFQLDKEDKFLATAEHHHVRVPFGQKAELKVNVSGESTDVTYQWYGPDDRVIPNESGCEYYATEAGDYWCYVTLDKEVCYVPFDVSIDTGFEVRSSDGKLGTVSMVVAEGSTPTLAVNATTIAMVDSSKFVYSWYRQDVKTDGSLGDDLISGETKNTYTTAPVNNHVVYSCSVKDGFGNNESISFDIQVDNGFKATVKGSDEESSSVAVAAGASVKLEVDAIANKTGFIYQWYQTDGQETLIEEAKSGAYVAKNVTKQASYRCDVTDFYGNKASVYFDVSVENALRATVKGKDESFADMEVEPNESITLEVTADATVKNFTYQWYQTDDEDTLISKADSDSYTVTNVMKKASYRCDVSDSFGNTDSVHFYISVKHDLYILDEDNQRQTFYKKSISILKGESLTLAPKIVGASKYEWSKGVYCGENPLYESIDESSSSVSIHGGEFSSGQTVEYMCIASDDYDNTITIVYDVELTEALHLVSNAISEDCYEFYQDESGRIGVTATTPDNVNPVIFKWYYSSSGDDGSYKLISTSNPTKPVVNRATASLSIENMQEEGYQYYRCEAQQGGETDSINIEVYIYSTLTAYAENSLVRGNKDSKVRLKVTAESTVSEPTYSWYRLDDDGNRSSVLGNTSSLDVSLSGGKDSYICVVTDKYGEREVSFATFGSSVATVEYGKADEKEKAADISCGSPLLVKWPDSSDSTSAIYLKFIPAIDGVYTIKSEGDADTVLDLLGADGTMIETADDKDNGNRNFYLKRSLEKNSTYYFKISAYDGGKAESLVSVVWDHTHTWRKLSEKPANCTEAGEKTEICDCGEKRTTSIPALGHVEETIPAVTATCTKTGLTEGTKCRRCGAILRAQQSTPVLGHSYGAWVQVKAPTALEEGYRERTCTRCGAKDPGRQMIAKLPATMMLNATSVPLQVKKSTTKLTVSGLAAGDSVASVSSSNTKIVKASWNGRVLKITAQKKTGKAKITITLRSGLSRTVTVEVQKTKVVSKKITGVPSKLTLKKGNKYQLTPGIQPITSSDKIKYSSSNKKIAKVSSKGIITAGKKPGKAIITVSAGKKKFKVKVTVSKK